MLADRVRLHHVFVIDADKLCQGYEISREEKEIPRDDFIARFQDETGEVESVAERVEEWPLLTMCCVVDAR